MLLFPMVKPHTTFLIPGNCLHMSTYKGQCDILLTTRKIVFNL